MGFKVVKESEKHSRVELIDEPDWVIGMQTLTMGVPTCLSNGVALVVAFSIWSTPDREMAYKAIEISKKRGIGVRIGLLPFDYPEELSTWLLDSDWEEVDLHVQQGDDASVELTISQSEGNSPLWFELHNGHPRLLGRGQLSEHKIDEHLRRLKAAGQKT